MQSEGIKVISASKEYIDAVEAAGYDVSHWRPKIIIPETPISPDCNGQHRFFVANTAAAEGKVFVFVVCTSCGAAKRHEFEVAKSSSPISLQK
jgi:hypothetical protein